jgi:DNA-binding transcriptional ArsR family regulator
VVEGEIMSESKLRVVMIEASGNEAAMSQAFAGMLAALNGASVETPAPPPIIATPIALPSAPAAPAQKRVAGERVRVKPKPIAPGEAPASAGAADAGPRGRIVAALAKRPMTSGDVAKETGLKQSVVYSTLHVLRKEGVVESREDDSSLYPMQHLVKK